MESEPMSIGRSSPTPTHINRPIDKPGCLAKIWNCFSKAISKLIECLKNIFCCRQSDPKISTFKKSYELPEDDQRFRGEKVDEHVAPTGRTLEEELIEIERRRDPLVRAGLI